MNILYVSTLCSDARFKELYNRSKKKPQQQAQKFHKLLSKGLKNYSQNICFISRPPINHCSNKRKNYLTEVEEVNGDEYHYLYVYKNPIKRHITLFYSSLIKVIKWKIKNKTKEKIIFCDILNLSISIPALLSSKICGIKSVAIVTDLPNYMNYTRSSKSSVALKAYRCLCNFFLKRYDYYIVLTEQMNKLVNPKGKPYIVIEGMVDNGMKTVPNELHSKYREKVIIYAGALYEKYGIKSLIEAFIRVKDLKARLWLFGDGEMVEEIHDYGKKDNRIKYFGVVPNEEVVAKQIKATLLINPRPSYEEYTKYSFPSKNMEYMASGTPVLTTPLPGMPQEYNDYLYLFNDETIDGMAKTIESILDIKKEELHYKGLMAKKFVLNNKNNIIQAGKIIDMLSNNHT